MHPAIWNFSHNIISHYYQLFPTDKDTANIKFLDEKLSDKNLQKDLSDPKIQFLLLGRKQNHRKSTD